MGMYIETYINRLGKGYSIARIEYKVHLENYTHDSHFSVFYGYVDTAGAPFINMV